MLRYSFIILSAVAIHSQQCIGQAPSEPDATSPIDAIRPEEARIRFRLLDQHDQPITKRSIIIANTGDKGWKEELEGLGQGEYVLTYEPYRRPITLMPILMVADADILPATYTLNAVAGEAIDMGVIRVHRFAEESKRKARIRVVDPEGKAVSGATLVANPRAVYVPADAQQRIKSDESGIVELDVYPTKYYVHAVHDDYLIRRADTFDFAALTSDDVSTLVVYPPPNYSIELAWMEFDGTTDEPVAQEVVQLSIQDGELVNASEQPEWINVILVNERVGFQFPNASETGFAGKNLITASMVNPPSDRASFYNSLTLDQPIEVCPFIEMPNWAGAPRVPQGMGPALTAIAEDIVIGVLEPAKRRADTNYIRFKIRIKEAATQKKLVAQPTVAESAKERNAATVVACSPNWITSLVPYAALLGAGGLLVLLLFYRRKIASEVGK